MDFWWDFQDGRWLLVPSSTLLAPIPVAQISVIQVDNYWVIHVVDRPMTLRYTSAQAAKLDAWQWAKSRRKALFGAYRMRLVSPHTPPRRLPALRRLFGREVTSPHA